MKNLTFQQAADHLDDASYTEPVVDTGRRAITFGIDGNGEQFVLISDGVTGTNTLGML